MKVHLYWWEDSNVTFKKNFGDVVGPYLVEKLIGKIPIKISHPSMRRYKYFITHYLTAGSIISNANANSIVWGSGIIRKDQIIPPAKYVAVRGPLTRKRIESSGVKCPKIYGDPAILLPEVYFPKIKPTYEIGIIPHYVDKEIAEGYIKNFSPSSYKIIDLLTEDVESVIDEILSCKKIISSSLHGLIVAHAYNINTIWAKFSDNLAGDDTKFYDYLQSVEMESLKFQDYRKAFPKTIEDVNDSFYANKEYLKPKISRLKGLQQNLLNACPFLKSRWHRILLGLRMKFNVLRHSL